MTNPYFEFMQSLAEDSFAASKQLSALTTQTLTSLTESNMSLFETYTDALTKQVAIMSASKDYKEGLGNQVNFVTDATRQFVETAKRNADVVVEANEAVSVLVNEQVDESLKKVVKAVPAKKVA